LYSRYKFHHLYITNSRESEICPFKIYLLARGLYEKGMEKMEREKTPNLLTVPYERTIKKGYYALT
jgi:hypothetical protein